MPLSISSSPSAATSSSTPPLKSSRPVSRITTAGLAFAGVLAAAAAIPRWLSFTLVGVESTCIPQLTGVTISRLLLPAALIIMIGAGALTISGMLLRRIIGITTAIAGIVIAVESSLIIANPISATEQTMNQMVGPLAGMSEIATSATSTWPMVSLMMGLLATVIGITIALIPGTIWSSTAPEDRW